MNVEETPHEGGGHEQAVVQHVVRHMMWREQPYCGKLNLSIC